MAQGSQAGFWGVEGKKGDEFGRRSGKGGAHGVWEQMACLSLSLLLVTSAGNWRGL